MKYVIGFTSPQGRTFKKLASATSPKIANKKARALSKANPTRIVVVLKIK